MSDRESIAGYIEARAAKYRQHESSPGWALARHDATLLEAIASEIRNELDVVENRHAR